jgi:hypothetical protein
MKLATNHFFGHSDVVERNDYNLRYKAISQKAPSYTEWQLPPLCVTLYCVSMTVESDQWGDKSVSLPSYSGKLQRNSTTWIVCSDGEGVPSNQLVAQSDPMQQPACKQYVCTLVLRVDSYSITMYQFLALLHRRPHTLSTPFTLPCSLDRYDYSHVVYDDGAPLALAVSKKTLLCPAEIYF